MAVVSEYAQVEATEETVSAPSTRGGLNLEPTSLKEAATVALGWLDSNIFTPQFVAVALAAQVLGMMVWAGWL